MSTRIDSSSRLMESFVILPVRRGSGVQVPNLARSVGCGCEKRRVRSLYGQHGIAVSVDDVSAQKRRTDFHLNDDSV